MPIALESIGGYDLTQLEIKLVEDKRDATFKKKAMLTPQAGATENNEGEKPDENMEDQPDKTETSGAAQTEDTPDVTDAAVAPISDTTDPASPVVHEGVTCDSCHMFPLTGVRFRCAKFVYNPFIT